MSLKKIKDYLAGAAVVGFDFETSPIEEYRSEERAALDAHKAAITGVSLSVSEDSGIYIPLRHRAGRNIQKPEAVMDYLRQAVFENATVIKVAHNLAFESMFLYALGVIVQPPCYDTIAAAQLTLKSSTAFRGLSDSGLKTLVPQLFHVELPDFETVTAGRFFDELDPQDQGNRPLCLRRQRLCPAAVSPFQRLVRSIPASAPPHCGADRVPDRRVLRPDAV